MSSQNDVIASGNHATLAFDKMKSLREKSVLCDITLKVKGTGIPAHKVVLAASSPYFEFMFTGNVKERTKECIEISGFSPEAFLTVVNFMYSGYLVINEETMLDVLEVADFLKISSAKEKCIQYLQEHMKISNCLQIRGIAKKYYFTELEMKVRKFIENNFVEFTESEGFLRLSVDEVKDVISEYSSYTDSSLYEEAISNWVEHEKCSREGMKDGLLGFFNVHIQNVAKNELVYNSLFEKRIYILDCKGSEYAVQFLDLMNFKWNISCFRPKFDCIPPIFHNQYIYLISNEECGRLNMDLEEWELKKMPFRNDYTAACSVHNGIYLITKGSSRGTFSYNPETNTLYSESQLLRERSGPGVAYSDNCLYVCGGGNQSAERRDLRTKPWRSISNLTTSKDECSATSLDDTIFLTSASSGEFFEFDKRMGIWTTKAKIPKVDNRPTVLGSTDEAIYGYNGETIFRYNMQKDEWKSVGTAKGWSGFVCVYPR